MFLVPFLVQKCRRSDSNEENNENTTRSVYCLPNKHDDINTLMTRLKLEFIGSQYKHQICNNNVCEYIVSWSRRLSYALSRTYFHSPSFQTPKDILAAPFEIMNKHYLPQSTLDENTACSYDRTVSERK